MPSTLVTVPRLLVALLAVATAARAQPDLALDLDTLAADVRTEVRVFAPDACVLQPSDLCVGGPGARKLLRFGVFAVNQGDADLVMGVPSADETLPNGDPRWTFSACHAHWHFRSFARYELRPRGGSEALLTGRKQSFCVEDTKPAPGVTGERRYCCRPTDECAMPGVQGIQAGWGDLYGSTLDCQWLDITDLPPGDYDLWVMLNPEGVLCGVGDGGELCESNPANNVGVVPVTVPGPSTAEPAPRVRLKSPHGTKARRGGTRLPIAWKTRMKGGRKALRVQDVFVSLDGGTTFTLLATGLDARAKRQTWDVPAGTATEQAVVKVVAWSQAGHRGEAVSKPFRIVP